MTSLVTVIHIVASVFLIIFVLIQSGKGAEISASFAGSSQTVFGSSGGANFFSRATAVLATVFMVTSLSLTLIQNKSRKSVFEGVATPPVQSSAPVAPPAAPEQGQTTSGAQTPADSHSAKTTSMPSAQAGAPTKPAAK